MARPAKALIDLAALRHNYRLAQSLSGGGQAMPIIKANAYGHGAVVVAKALEPQAPAFGVACIEEALELRESGITKPILLLQGAFSDEEVFSAQKHKFWLMVGSKRQADSITWAELPEPVKVWLKIDTGMSRLGVLPHKFDAIYQQLKASDNVQPGIVLTTHFACADELDNKATTEQIELFEAVTTGIDEPRSLANSAGLLAWEASRGDWNRPGFMLYGNSPIVEQYSHPEDNELRPVMTLRSQIIALRKIEAGQAVGYSGSWRAERNSRIATVTIGYGDGYPRHAPSGTPVLVNGQRAPLVGRVSMDMITVDVTDLNDVEVGDEVILWGNDLSVNEVAECAGTIGYELLTRMPPRTPRIYKER